MRLVRHTLAAALLVGGASMLDAQATLRPAPSGRATSEVTLSYPRDQTPAGAQPVTIRLDYGQPHLRGRTLHTDSLVPYDQPWRTGANAPTTLTTGVDLTIGGQTVPKGAYVVFTLPSRSGWKLILQKGDSASMAAAAQYNPANDFVRIDLKQQTLPAPLESLTMWLIPATAPGLGHGELRIAWGTTMHSTVWVVKQ